MRFLGVLLKRRGLKGGRYTLRKANGKKMNRADHKILFSAPIRALIERLDSRGFLAKGKPLRGKSMEKLLNLPIKEMIL